MARSNSHKLGELIGNFFENAMRLPLARFADEHGLYLDYQKERPTRSGKKVSYYDNQNNKHDLDFVLEKNGSETVQGEPVAFIELAWRRYTKHSKNKVQEIAGAIIPLVEKYGKTVFKGCILSGEFTAPSIRQLMSQGFSVLYFDYKEIIDFFSCNGLDIDFDEDTSEEEMDKKCTDLERYLKTPGNLDGLNTSFFVAFHKRIMEFTQAMARSVERKIRVISILPLHGECENVADIDEAVCFLQNYNESRYLPIDMQYIEITIKYNNGSQIEGRFRTRYEAMEFLRSRI